MKPNMGTISLHRACTVEPVYIIYKGPTGTIKIVFYIYGGVLHSEVKIIIHKGISIGKMSFIEVSFIWSVLYKRFHCICKLKYNHCL